MKLKIGKSMFGSASTNRIINVNCNICNIKDHLISVKEIVDENFQDYKKSSMMIATTKCDFKCFKNCSYDENMCQNLDIVKKADIKINASDIWNRYILNPITHAIVIGGLEPILQFDEIYNLIRYFRQNSCYDDFVIYTGYYKDEILDQINLLREFDNIIIKYGRFIPNSKKIFDRVLGVYLGSNNQYAEKIS